ncbi:MAG TPA: cob(I)yrinic acid a,c-diamide adenosyltransferase [Polyangiaceae bacterium]|nr:cob(I)yrinic acid a,c-diamide adenosyltransferase [Polyangiaceae bacterium]
MKIYTRTGDKGDTGLFGGARVPKDDDRVEAYGTVDETNAAIGVARSHCQVPFVQDILDQLQSDLFTLGAELATVSGHESKLGIELLNEADVAKLEQAIDQCEEPLPPLKNFILPGGPPDVAALHLARTVARRAERRVLTLSQREPVRATVLVYLNRLADLLFVLARRAQHENGGSDVAWAPRGRRA